MKIGVISDTHLSRPSEALNRLSATLFSGIDLVLHAGDLTHASVLSAFTGKQVVAVQGHRVPWGGGDGLPEQQVIEAKGYRIGLIHGRGPRRGMEERLLNLIGNVHCIVFGHTHVPVNRICRGVLMFNPGSFSGSRLFRRNPSVGILTIDNGITGQIVPIHGCHRSRA